MQNARTIEFPAVLNSEYSCDGAHRNVGRSRYECLGKTDALISGFNLAPTI